MSTLYWITEYSKVLLAYLFLTFVWPSVLFRGYLKGKGKTFWFAFCSTVSVMLITTVVLFLGILHILNVWVVRGLFFSTFLFFLLKPIRFSASPNYTLYKLTSGTYGTKLFLLHFTTSIRTAVSTRVRLICADIKKHFLEYVMLLALIIYCMIYFGYGPMTHRIMGTGDAYVHSSWVYGLSQGKVFSNGVYPEAMHCFIYSFYALFGIRLFSVLLFIQAIHTVVFLLSGYLFVREFFKWRFSGILMLAIFLTLKMDGVNGVFSITRFQWPIPQEFALHTALLIPVYLVRYLKYSTSVTRKGKKTKLHWDENLLLFSLLISLSFAAHFYCTIMAIFACIGVVIVWWWKVFHWRKFFPLAIAAIMAIVIAGAPMLTAFLTGTRLEGSLYWAMSIMEPGSSASSETENSEETEPSEAPTAPSSTANSEIAETQAAVNTPNPVVTPKAPTVPLTTRIQLVLQRIQSRIETISKIVRQFSYRALYHESLSNTILILTGIAVLLSLIGGKWFRGYGMVAWMSLVFMVAYSASPLGLPVVVSNTRLCAVIHIILLTLLVLPFDLVFSCIGRVLPRGFNSTCALICSALLIAFIVKTGNFHGFLYVGLTRYNSAVHISNSIMSDIPYKQFTIVATTDDIYQINLDGFHEEWLTFMKNQSKDEYYIPTPYVFFYVEKQPLGSYIHYFTGPAWLGSEIYPAYYVDRLSQCPDYVHGEISDELAEQNIPLFLRPSDTYGVLSSREIVESKAHKWCEEMMERFPNEMNIYYEDEYMICYCLHQNPYRLMNLAYGG